MRVVRVLPEGTIDKTFDYLVPEHLGDQVRVGTQVRVALHGRRVGGWVVAVDAEPPAGVRLREIAKITGVGPPAELVELSSWAAWRWAGRRSHLLTSASAPVAVRALPPSGPGPAGPAATLAVAGDDELGQAALAARNAVVRLPPAHDPYGLVAAATGRGNALVVCPSVDLARSVAVRLRRAGVAVALHPRDWALGAAGASVVGARAAAWAPVAGLAAVVVLDEHDEALQEERAPTWHARDVAIERARRAGVPCVLVSPCPSLEALAWGTLLHPSRADERSGWPVVEVVDLERIGPGSGLLTPQATRWLRGDRRVVCVLNRTGRAKLLACAACRQLARCERCGAALAQTERTLDCRRCGATRPVVCAGCGSTRMRLLRPGVARVREEIEALIGEPVLEVTAATDPGRVADTRVVVGTEAALHRAVAADVVVFLDIDQELLAPRYRAGEQALALLARAGRLVGGRRGRLVVQTRVPRHPVLDAVLHADPGRLIEAERDTRRLLGFPPFQALASVSGPGAAAVADLLAPCPGITVLGPADDRYLVRAPDHRTLCDALAAVPRPAERARIEVDPPRV